MAYVDIDGIKYEISSGKTIIEVAYNNGLSIPHFCWHPELSVSGNCRMCLVEVGSEKKLPDGTIEKDANGIPKIIFSPKLQIACATQVFDGMYVRTVSDEAVKAQEAVMEFLLINHPLDCPICDEAGQCKLQEYAFDHSKGESRFTEEKQHKLKRIPWSDNIMYDGERCILCSRCIRFSKEYACQDVLTFIDRNDKVTIELGGDAQLDNPYSMNVIDICPVGALTSKDFRFSARVWEMSFNRSICLGCSRGCNIKYGIRNNEILRIEPAINPFVNKYWMCDYGRLEIYSKINLNRLAYSFIRKHNILNNVDLNNIIDQFAIDLKKYKPSEILFVASAKTSNENNFVFSQFAKEMIKNQNVYYFEHIEDDFSDQLLRKKDKTPNSNCMIEFGISKINSNNILDLIELINTNKIKALVALEEDFEDYPEFLIVVDKIDLKIVFATNISELTNKAEYVFAVSSPAESEGTFINFDGRVQYFSPALVTKENVRNMGMKMSRLDKFGASNDRWTQHEQRNVNQSWRIITQIALQFNAKWKYNESSDVFNEITARVSGFKNMTYSKLQEFKGIKLNQANIPEKKSFIYESHYRKPQ